MSVVAVKVKKEDGVNEFLGLRKAKGSPETRVVLFH
jgi:hypothetical protein